MSVGEERRHEVLENRKTFRRLNKEILEGIQRRETVTVTARNGEECELVLHPITEVHLLEIGEKYGINFEDLQAGKVSSKLRFMAEVVAAVIVESPELSLTSEGIDEALDPKESARLFTMVMGMSGMTVKAQADVDKFRGKPPQPSH